MFVNFKFIRKKTGLDLQVLEAFKSLPMCFTTLEIVSATNELDNSNYLESTIMRMLRDLRQRNKINYKCFNAYRSEYRKT